MSSAVKIFQGRFGRVALLDMNASLVGHAHHHCHILLKAGGADSAFRVRGNLAPLSDELAVLVNAWEYHAYEHSSPERTLILALYIEPNWLAAFQRSLTMSAHPRFFSQSTVRLTERTRKTLEQFVLELWWSDSVAPQRLEELLFALIIEVIGSCSALRDLSSLLRLKPPSLVDFRIRRAISYMRDHVGGDFDVDELTALTGLSRAHFFALFQRETQVTPMVYANVLRFEQAVNRLSHGQDSVGDISVDLGFSAPSHFSRFFRSHLGISPSDYRRKVNFFDPLQLPLQSGD